MNLKTLLAIAIGAVGVFFVASGVQGSGADVYTANWFGQQCIWNQPYQSWCLHPEWFAVGAALLAMAYLVSRQARE